METVAAPRRACLDCVKKHLATADRYFEWALKKGRCYRWVAIGNLVEARAEALGIDKDIADSITMEILKTKASLDYIPNVLALITKIDGRVY